MLTIVFKRSLFYCCSGRVGILTWLQMLPCPTQTPCWIKCKAWIIPLCFPNSSDGCRVYIVDIWHASLFFHPPGVRPDTGHPDQPGRGHLHPVPRPPQLRCQPTHLLPLLSRLWQMLTNPLLLHMLQSRGELEHVLVGADQLLLSPLLLHLLLSKSASSHHGHLCRDNCCAKILTNSPSTVFCVRSINPDQHTTNLSVNHNARDLKFRLVPKQELKAEEVIALASSFFSQKQTITNKARNTNIIYQI